MIIHKSSTSSMKSYKRSIKQYYPIPQYYNKCSGNVYNLLVSTEVTDGEISTFSLFIVFKRNDNFGSDGGLEFFDVLSPLKCRAAGTDETVKVETMGFKNAHKGCRAWRAEIVLLRWKIVHETP